MLNDEKEGKLQVLNDRLKTIQKQSPNLLNN